MGGQFKGQGCFSPHHGGKEVVICGSSLFPVGEYQEIQTRAETRRRRDYYLDKRN